MKVSCMTLNKIKENNDPLIKQICRNYVNCNITRSALGYFTHFRQMD